jgi:hypothetical protein
MIKLWIYCSKENCRACSAVARATLCTVVITLFGCVSASAKFDSAARHLGLNKIVTSGQDFQHVIYENAVTTPHSKLLNIYIGSDGTPWNFDVPSKDPTPRNPITLKLLIQDRQPAIFVGRPCYHGLAGSDECNESIWTSARFSQAVVDSMVKVIGHYLDQHSYQSIRLVGYSGGGTLAALIAAQMDQVTMLLTVAPNLDIDAWTSHHSYEPLSASVNPANEPPLPESIRQVHYFGALDSNVPMSTTDRFFLVNRAAERREITEFDHVCCWEAVWPSILLGDEQAR